jgi:hypothetical protein
VEMISKSPPFSNSFAYTFRQEQPTPPPFVPLMHG